MLHREGKLYIVVGECQPSLELLVKTSRGRAEMYVTLGECNPRFAIGA